MIIIASGTFATLHVIDAETGDPVTPPLVHGGPVVQTSYHPGPRTLSTATRAALYQWDLKAVPYDLADLETLARLLSGLRPDDLGGTMPVLADELARELDALNARLGAGALVPDAHALAGWHYCEWESLHDPGRTQAVSFHLGALVPLRPRQPFLRRRLAEALFTSGRTAEAFSLLEDERKLQQTLPECDRLDAAGVLLWLGIVAGRDKPAEARKYFRQALELATAASGEKSLDAAKVLTSLGDFEKSQGNYADAEKHYQAALSILAATLPDDDVERTSQNLSLAFCVFKQSQTDRAETILLEQYRRLQNAAPAFDGTPTPPSPARFRTSLISTTPRARPTRPGPFPGSSSPVSPRPNRPSLTAAIDALRSCRGRPCVVFRSFIRRGDNPTKRILRHANP